MLTKVWAAISRNPARSYSIALAAVALLAAFGLDLTGEQIGAVTAFLALVFGQATHTQVTPLVPGPNELPPVGDQ